MVRKVKWFQKAAVALGFGFLLLWPSPSIAGEWQKPPFDLWFEDFLPIPDGRGVSFFHDVWVDYSGHGGGGPMTITPEFIAHYDSDMPVK